jgi:hypothetical protein
MAAPDFSAAWALNVKAGGLFRAGHVARSNEYMSRALAAAQAVGEPDCLIVAELQVASASALDDAAVVVTDAARRADLLRTAFEQLFAAVATLQRRRTAGTLLAGACRPAEEAWHEQSWVLMTTAWTERVPDGEAAANAAKKVAPLVGYDLLLRVANLMLFVSERLRLENVPITLEQLRFVLLFVADAVELMSQPRAHEELPLPMEGHFAGNVKAVVSMTKVFLRLDEFATRLVMECLDRLERSGVPERRGFAAVRDRCIRDKKTAEKAAAAAAAAPGLRTCSLASCGAREQHPKHFRPCSACRIPVYCCKECQVVDWPSHKAACKAARKAATENAG